jgi:hypothetical protein
MKHLKIYEGYLNTEDTFTTKIEHRDVDVDGYELPDKDSYIEAGDMKVVWALDIDARSTGINSISPMVKKVTGNFSVVTPTENEDKTDEVEFSSDDWNLEVAEGGSVQFGYGIYPSAVEIDYKKKLVKVSF